MVNLMLSTEVEKMKMKYHHHTIKAFILMMKNLPGGLSIEEIKKNIVYHKMT